MESGVIESLAATTQAEISAQGPDEGENESGSDIESDSHGNQTLHSDFPESSRHSNIPESTRPTSTSDTLWDNVKAIPKSKKHWNIYLDVPVETHDGTKYEWEERFRHVKRRLEDQAKNLRLDSNPIYDLRMVGSNREDARPTIVVNCREADRMSLRKKFEKVSTTLNIELEPERGLMGFIHGISNMHRTEEPESRTIHKARLRVAYYGMTAKQHTVIRMALSGPLQTSISDDGLTCGAITQYGGAYATLGVALHLGIGSSSPVLMTVNHLFPCQAPTSPSPLGGAYSPAFDSDTSSYLRRSDRHIDTNPPWNEDDDEDDCGDDYEDEYEDDFEDSYEDSTDTERSLQFDRSSPVDVPTRARPEVVGNSSLMTSRASRLDQTADSELWELVEPDSPLDAQYAYLDWALIRPTLSQNNPTTYSHNTFFPQGRTMGEAVVIQDLEISPLNHLAPVYMISGMRGVKYGQIITAPSFIPSVLPQQESCGVWTVILDERENIVAGECGSVIVDRVTNRIYGHVVASNTLGYIYVVPLAHVIDQINACFSNANTPVRLAAPRARENTGVAQDEKIPMLLGTPALERHSGFTCGHESNNLHQSPEDPQNTSGNESPRVPYGASYYDIDDDKSTVTSNQPSQYISSYATTCTGDSSSFGRSSNFSGDPCFPNVDIPPVPKELSQSDVQSLPFATEFTDTSALELSSFGVGSNFVADLPPIPEFELPTVLGSFGYNTPSGGLALDERSRDVYRALLGIPTAIEETGNSQHTLESSFYQGSSSNLGDVGGDLDFLTTLSPDSITQEPSSSSGSKARRPRKPPESRKKYECSHADCPWSFDQPKDLKRHLESLHADENTPLYNCRCNYRTSRKSNYQRHLGRRSDGQCKDPDIWTVFTCKCGCASFADVNDQTKHLDTCEYVSERLGRPPKKA